MHDAEGQERGQGHLQHPAVGTVHLGDGGQEDGPRHILDEVGMAAGCDEQRRRRVGCLVGVITKDDLVLHTASDHAPGEEGEVGCEGQGEGPGHGWGEWRRG